MGDIRVASINPARRNNGNGGRIVLQIPDLHRGGVRAYHGLIRNIERVMVGAGGMVFWYFLFLVSLVDY